MKIRRRRVGRSVLTIFFTLLFTSGVGMAIQKQFRIQKVEVVGAQISVIIDEDKMNKNLLFFPTKKVRMQLLKQNPLLKNIVIQKIFPHTIRIVATSRRPIAIIAESHLLVDSEGVILGAGETADNSLPLVYVAMADPALRQSLEILRGLGKENGIVSITKGTSGTLLAKTSTIDIYFPQNDTILDKVATLQTLLAGFRIKGILPNVIDLRFDKPIVTF